MRTVPPLLEQLRRKQFLICVYRPEGEAPMPRTVPDIRDTLHLDSAECARLVRRLARKGLIEEITEEEAGLRLTVRGERLVRRMARPRSTTEMHE